MKGQSNMAVVGEGSVALSLCCFNQKRQRVEIHRNRRGWWSPNFVIPERSKLCLFALLRHVYEDEPHTALDTRRVLAADRRMSPGRSAVDKWIMFLHSSALSPDDFPTVEISFVRSLDGSRTRTHGQGRAHRPASHPPPLHATPHDYAVCAYYNDSHRLNSSGRRSARTGKRGSPALRAVFEEPKTVFGRFRPVLVTPYVHNNNRYKLGSGRLYSYLYVPSVK